MIFALPPASLPPLRAAINRAYLADETEAILELLTQIKLDDAARRRIHDLAKILVTSVRDQQQRGGVEAFLHEYDLSSQEGVVLMCLAEALLRIPDAETADRLIRDKLSKGQWDRHLGQSQSLLVNASTWGLMLTGRVVTLEPATVDDAGGLLRSIFARSGEAVVRPAIRQAMRIMGEQFVMGSSLTAALKRCEKINGDNLRYSFDMLGEAAMTQGDANRYQQAYADAIIAIRPHLKPAQQNLFEAPGISVKLSALHPRYEFAQRDRVLSELVPRLSDLAILARDTHINLTLDAEEADRLDLSLDIFEAVFQQSDFAAWEGFGLAVQAYQKRAIPVLNWLIDLARRHQRRIPVRLVKGAYWDTEIKRAQQAGLPSYPVYTRKLSTDVSYLACVRLLFDARDAIYPQFATHNAQTIASIFEIAGRRRDFEFQRLHGMGAALYGELSKHEQFNVPCRVYAPVGTYRDLLPYLVRRLLENGANTSFVNRIEDMNTPVEALIKDPLTQLQNLKVKPHPRIPLPRDLFPDRINSAGLNLSDDAKLAKLARSLTAAMQQSWTAAPVIGGHIATGKSYPIVDPGDHRRIVGTVVHADAQAVEQAYASAAATAPAWGDTPVEQRAKILERAADLFEQHQTELLALCIREAGKTLPDAVAELRETVDYCRYYALMARTLFATPLVLTGPTGEHNEMNYHGRGVFACISPWNFPLAIFMGQVTAALAAGNVVIAKPASQTALIAYRAVGLLHEAGIPAGALHFVPGSARDLGPTLMANPHLAGIAFTGSTETAWQINRALAARNGAIIPLIAETGGQNVMIVDSTALPEQVVKDVIRSAFNSAGQRCSALRVLLLQEEIADKVMNMLAGAMAELRIGDQALLATDIGPVIDDNARQMLQLHIERMRESGRQIFQVRLPADTAPGSYIAPVAFEIDTLSQLQHEVFGPVLHIIRYQANNLEQIIADINNLGYGLTLGIHSRIEQTASFIRQRVRAGNCYVNRDVVGATVGVQPFGGEGLSGTGPKAGGPNYLLRFAVERTLTINTTAAGGNTTLLSLGD